MVYFAVNNHMYLILDSAVRKSLIERTKVKENFNTSLLEHEEEKEGKVFLIIIKWLSIQR